MALGIGQYRIAGGRLSNSTCRSRVLVAFSIVVDSQAKLHAKALFSVASAANPTSSCNDESVAIGRIVSIFV